MFLLGFHASVCPYNHRGVCSPPPQADIQVETMRQHFQEESLDYVCKLQEIQERKKFECVEPVSVQARALVWLVFHFDKIKGNSWRCHMG